MLCQVRATGEPQKVVLRDDRVQHIYIDATGAWCTDTTSQLEAEAATQEAIGTAYVWTVKPGMQEEALEERWSRAMPRQKEEGQWTLTWQGRIAEEFTLETQGQVNLTTDGLREALLTTQQRTLAEVVAKRAGVQPNTVTQAICKARSTGKLVACQTRNGWRLWVWK